ncbi:energy transducer TonB [Undibacterium sp. CY7W]|uniref:Energy transducer TonB n=1 Tax=Undibacterium rugosum TaxID=2762291 RepID=A0A923I3N2_9BURK|nr:energy transducer TonB [Undibacterium rugosum]MBC3935755.1 energy transducer TonB [Undibacterium rugosum]
MTLNAHQSAAPLPDEVKRRLSFGLLVSVLLHLLVLSLRFGIPGSGPAASLSSAPSLSEPVAEVPQLALRITMPAPPAQSSAMATASASAEKTQPASNPALSSVASQSRTAEASVHGIQLIAPRPPAAVSPPPPIPAKTTKTKRAHATQTPVVPKRKIALSEVKAVIAQDQFRLDSFVVAAQAPEDVKKTPEEETERRRFPDPVSQSGEEKEDDPVAVAPERYQADAEKRQRKQAERERQFAAQISETTDMRSQQTLVGQIQQNQKNDIAQFRLAQAETDRQEQEKAEQEKRAAELRELKKQEQEKQEKQEQQRLAQLRQEQQLQQANTAAEQRLSEVLQQHSQPAVVADAGLQQQLAQEKQMRELQKNQRHAALQKRELEREQEREQQQEQERQQLAKQKQEQEQARQQRAAQQQREAELQAAAKATQAAQAAQIAAAQSSMAETAQSQARAVQVIAGNSSVSQHAAPAQGKATVAGAGAAASAQVQNSQSGNGSAGSNGQAAIPGAGSGNAGGNAGVNGNALATASQSSLQSDLANRLREQARGLDLLRGAPPVPRESAEKSRRRSVFSNSERDVQLRAYADSWKQKIERNGNLNYSSTARDKARGDPIVTVAIRSDGTVEEVTIHRSSGRMDLDQAVRNIVRLNTRYAAFPPAVAAQYDVIEIRRIWSFDDSLRLLEELR